MPPNPKNLGQILLGKGWITQEQLARALSRQRGSSLRLGTCLLELDALSEEVLLRALGEQLSLPTASADDLRRIPEEVIDLLPAKLALRVHAVPYRATSSAVDVALLDARNLAIHDELGFVLGKRARIHVGLEARVLEALEKHYGAELPSRIASLLDRLNRARYLWDRDRKPIPQAAPEDSIFDPPSAIFRLPPSLTPAPAAKPTPPAARTTPAAPTTPQPPSEPPVRTLSRWPETTPRLSPHEVRPPTPLPERGPLAAAPVAPSSALQASPPVAPARSTAALTAIPLDEAERDALRRSGGQTDLITRSELESRLEQAVDRDQVAATVVDFLHQTLPRVALFMVKRDRVAGWLARGRGFDPVAFERFAVDSSRPSVFVNLRQGSAFYRGPLPPLPLHRELARCWGGRLPRDCVLVPVRIKDRLVSILYADTDGREGATIDLEATQELGARLAGALEACIVKLKAERAGRGG